MLEDEVRVDEVERGLRELRQIGCRDEGAVRQVCVELLGTRDHALGDVDPDVFLEPRRERAREPPDATAEVEDAAASGRQPKLITRSQCRLHVGLSGREKPLEVPAPAPEPVGAEHRPEWIDLGQVLPVPLVPVGQATPEGCGPRARR